MKLTKRILKICLVVVSFFIILSSFQNCTQATFDVTRIEPENTVNGIDGDSETDGNTDTGNDMPLPGPVVVPDLARLQAADEVANTNETCSALKPFYWEVGNKDGVLASGSTGDKSISAATRMSIASASKWIFGAYVAEKRKGSVSDYDMKFMTMRSGYTNFKVCPSTAAATIQSCLESGTNGVLDVTTENKFDYGGGHFERWAFENGLASMNRSQLDVEYESVLGNIGFKFNSPQPAGGLEGSASDYAAFLRRILRGELQISGLLGYKAVCTEPTRCSDALGSPFSPEDVHYSVGHWVEDDSQTNGDQSFSSPGAFGFYPWIDSTKTYYGIVARSDLVNGAKASVNCGRLIRRAFLNISR